MAQSSCPKCGEHSFELKENSPKNSNYKYIFIQCSNCGTVVGTTEFNNIGKLISRLAKELNIDLFH